MILPEALDAALAARYHVREVKRPATHRGGLKARMGQLEKLHGGHAGPAAASAGIPVRTWRDWKNGTHPPSSRGIRRLEGAYARQVIAPQVAKLVTRSPVHRFDITATVAALGPARTDGKPRSRYVNGSTPQQAHRTFRADQVTGTQAQRVVNAWMMHGPEAAAQLLVAVIADAYQQQFEFEGDHVSVEIH